MWRIRQEEKGQGLIPDLLIKVSGIPKQGQVARLRAIFGLSAWCTVLRILWPWCRNMAQVHISLWGEGWEDWRTGQETLGDLFVESRALCNCLDLSDFMLMSQKKAGEVVGGHSNRPPRRRCMGRGEETGRWVSWAFGTRMSSRKVTRGTKDRQLHLAQTISLCPRIFFNLLKWTFPRPTSLPLPQV